MLRVFIIVWLLGLLSLPVKGQQILFGNYSVSEGLPSTMVKAINQDDQGYMWFGTRNGLSRFDGYQFKNFRSDKLRKGTLGNNFVHCITRYDSTHLWIGTDNGVYILNLETEKFTLFKPAIQGTISDIMKDHDGYVWITTPFTGLFRYDAKKDSLLNFVPNGSSTSVSSNQISKIAQDNDGRIWIATLGAGIDIYDPVTKRFSNIREGMKGLSSDVVHTIYKGIDGTMWAGTLTGGLCKWEKEKQQFKSYRSNGNDYSINDNIVRAIYQNTPDKIYVGTEKGLNILYTESEKFIAYTNKINDPFAISDNAIYTIFPDKSGNIWLGTWFGGVTYFNASGSSFELYYPNTERESLSGRAVSCFLEHEPGKFWIGTEDAGLFYFDSYKKNFLKYPFEAGQQKLSYHNVHCLLRDKKGKIWIGIFAGGINVLDPVTNKLTRYSKEPGNPNSLNSNLIFSIYEDRDGDIWVGTARGIERFDAQTNSFIEQHAPEVNNNLVYDIYEDNNKTIWFATHNNNKNGIVFFNKKSKQWSTFKSDASGNTLSSNKVICFHDDNAGTMWIGTEGGGLNRYDIKTKQLRVYNEIAANVIYGIQEDDEDLLWLTTNNGIYSLNPQTNKVKHFTRQDHLQSQQFNHKAFYKASDGKLFAGGIKGFNSFDPKNMKFDLSVPVISFTNFQLFNKDVSLYDSTRTGTKQISYTRSILLDHDQTVFSLEYAAPGSNTPEKLRYAYMMEGFDPGWNYVGEQRKATYTNLSPGKYILKVKATTDEANWNSPEKSIVIIIKPPFYRTTLAYIIYVLLLAGLVYAVFQYYAAYIQKQNAIRLERLKNKEEQEFYAKKIEFFTVMAHEIRTPLSLIIAPLERLLAGNKWEKAEKEQLETMDENADRLLNLVNQLLDFRRIESDAYKIKKEEVEIVALVQAIYTRFSSHPYQKDIEFTMSTNISSVTILADPEVLNKILSNLLINAFKFARRVVKININESAGTENTEKLISISVEDDGIGIPAANLKDIFKIFFTTTNGDHEYHNLGGSGIGLALAKSLSERHGSRLLVNSKEGQKTVFTIELPYTDIKESSLPDDIKQEKTVTDPADEKLPAILIVEDDAGIQAFIEKTLKADGYRVEKADNGKKAIQIVEQKAIDLIISDIMMPVMDGFELCNAVKTNINFCHIPVILLTARGNSEAELKGIETGADAYILKPFKWTHVSATVKNLLHSRESLKMKFSEQPTSDISVLTTNKRDKDFMEQIVGIIKERIIDPQLSVEELSKQMAMSRSSLHKKLKSLSGYVPNELIKLVRLKQSARLLELNQHSIADIAYMTGFGSPSYFSKCFQQQFHLTPKEFVDSHLKKGKEADGGLINKKDFV